MSSDAALPRYLNISHQTSIPYQLGVVLFGVVLMSLLAQISIPLPWTPVPISGQTFGVSLMALVYGRRLGVVAILGYLVLGMSGLPVLSTAGTLGPTLGYLLGMAFSAAVVGTLADRGYTRGFWTSFLACVLGSLCVFTLGLAVLSRFVPAGQLLWTGLLPFIPGDLIKSALASSIATSIRRRI